MTPEEKARQKIDLWFAEAGWKVINREDYEPTCTAVAIREGLLKGNLEADYFLFINGKAIGVLEAKREEIDPFSNNVCEQAVLYAKSVPHIYQAYQKPLPFIFTSNGKELFFCDFREQKQSFKQIMAIPTPYELVKQLGISDYFAGLPSLQKKGLRDCQYEAVTELEKSFRSGQNRALMVLATGAGKTYTACLAAYRLLSYTPMRRVLFLVDRNNLGKQAEGEFGTFRLTENGDAFNTIFTVNRLRSSSIPSDSNVVISTIQRLFSFLRGDTIEDNDNDDDNEPTEEVVLPPNPNLPHDYFDLIIIDECHRSIYGNWRKVLEYFDTARLVGLTATPIPETMAFFNNNRIVNYTLEKSIVDGVNVDCRVYRIKTQVTENGGAILEGEKIKEETRYTGDVKTISNKETKTYTNKELNRSVINPAQIKLILSTYRDVVYTELFNDPQREANFDYLPKTLIFALNETHASNIVQIAKEVFGHTDDRFVQKITYSAGDSNELIRQFRNDKDFRIAVTCTLVATGTDVKPLEVLIFMRDVRSKNYFEQMKGRGTRVLSKEDLQKVTPSATENKDHFVIVDAVGVTKSKKSDTRPLERKPTVSMKELMMNVALGAKDEDTLTSLANRVIRLNSQMSPAERKQFEAKVGTAAGSVAENLLNAFDEDVLTAKAQADTGSAEVTEEQLKQAQKELIQAAVAPFHDPDVRDYIENVRRSHDQIIDNTNIDSVLFAGFDTQQEENADRILATFHEFIEENKDEIIALRIIYNESYKDRPMAIEQLKELYGKLKAKGITVERLWDCYAIKKPDKVKRGTMAQLTDLISIIRFEMGYTDNLSPFADKVNYNFMQWTFKRNAGHIQFTEEQMEWLRLIKDHIATSLSILPEDLDLTPFDKKGGLLGFYESFGDDYEVILNEMNRELVA